MSTIDQDAMLGENTSIEVEDAENLSTRDILEQAYEKLEEPETPEVKAEPAAEPEAKAEEAASEQPVEEAKPVLEPAPKPGEVKAPRMWSPEAREKFAALPPDVQAEIGKREREIDTRLRETAQERQVSELARKTLDPYLDVCREIGIAPFEAVRQTMELGTRLHKGNGQQKAQIIAQLVTRYGVDIQELENQLVTHISRPPEVTQLEQRLAQLEQQNSSLTQAQQQAATQEHTKAIEAFVADPKNEFVQDVWQEMTILLNTGKAETLHDAYETACRMNKQVWQTMQSRSQQQANRIAAGKVSLKGGAPRNTSNAKPQPKTTRAALEAAWDDLASE